MQQSASENRFDDLHAEAGKFLSNKQYHESAECMLEAYSLEGEDHYNIDYYFMYMLGLSPVTLSSEYSKAETREKAIKEVEESLIARYSKFL